MTRLVITPHTTKAVTRLIAESAGATMQHKRGSEYIFEFSKSGAALFCALLRRLSNGHAYDAHRHANHHAYKISEESEPPS